MVDATGLMACLLGVGVDESEYSLCEVVLFMSDLGGRMRQPDPSEYSLHSTLLRHDAGVPALVRYLGLLHLGLRAFLGVGAGLFDRLRLLHW